MQFRIEVKRDGVFPTVWEATVRKDGAYVRKFEAVTIGRAIRKAKRFVREYAEWDIEVGR